MYWVCDAYKTAQSFSAPNAVLSDEQIERLRRELIIYKVDGPFPTYDEANAVRWERHKVIHSS